MTTKHALPPVVDEKSSIVILGTLPGDESLRLQQYYANPNNQFWRLLSEIYGAPVGTTYPERLQFLVARRLAVWDVLARAQRVGSADSAIRNAKPNDFSGFLTAFPRLGRVAFNGTSAARLWERHIASSTGVPERGLTASTLPSSSGAPGRHVLRFDEKVARWREVLCPAP